MYWAVSSKQFWGGGSVNMATIKLTKASGTTIDVEVDKLEAKRPRKGWQ